MTDTPQYPYQNASLDVETRVEDLLSRMTLEDKTGLMFHPVSAFGEIDGPGVFGSPSTRRLFEKRINHFNVLQAPTARGLAEWANSVQKEWRKHPLGIPVTISTDPRHSFGNNPGTAILAGPFSQWPETLGFGALDDPDLTERFADTIRREYLAVGIRLALHPQLDLATEPRWARASSTFGQDAGIAGRLGAAYVRGLQGKQLGGESVTAMVKHFPGGGPQKDGEDPHFSYGREQVYPGGMFEYHLEPFKEVFAAGASQVMPYYGMPMGIGYEEVGFAFSRAIVTDLLRDQLGFDGIVCSDWGILSGTFWGVEHLTYEERMLKALDAGIDQFGGEFRPEILAKLVRNGQLPESRLDLSVRRLLREKFVLGLFDNPFVDVERADVTVGTAEAREDGLKTQAAAHTLLINNEGANHLPLQKNINVYIEGVEAAAFAGRANVVASPAEADVAILRLVAPWEQRGKPGSIEFFMHAGSLDFPDERITRIRAIAAQVPTVLDIYLDRPAILTPFTTMNASLVVNFGATDEAFTRVVFGEAEPKGKLPLQIPSSMEEVLKNLPDVPGDTANPAFEYGFGLRYDNWTAAPAPTDEDRALTTVQQANRFDFSTATFADVMDDPTAGPILVEVIPGLEKLPMLDMMRNMAFTHVLDIAAGDLGAETITKLKDRLTDS
ncbi:glycoside hydrolase family 3 protein [Paenarthrobacter sp. NPDC089714]|uniref:glycoside hydrolase family 3 protein n=1 Tax=Paenarthrobacter sp. NPDC089714 TaxID=3364377 RepID=UPI0037F50004